MDGTDPHGNQSSLDSIDSCKDGVGQLDQNNPFQVLASMSGLVPPGSLGSLGSYQQMPDQSKEKVRIQGRMGHFNSKDNAVWKAITEKFGHNIKQPELLSIAHVLAQSANVKLDRDAKRRKTVLIKWFAENWPNLEPYLQYVVLEDNAV